MNTFTWNVQGMSPKQKGLLINRIAPTCAVAKILKVGDVLLSFDKEPIANDGTSIHPERHAFYLSFMALMTLIGCVASFFV